MILHLFRIFATFLCIVLFVTLWGWFFRPDLPQEALEFPPEKVTEAEALRTPFRIPEEPPVIIRRVDYSAGPSAPWYPKSESPILAELVREGKLPPVHERVGPEPLVMLGVEGIGRYGGTWIQAAISHKDLRSVKHRLSNCSLVRWSPMGYPIMPNLARDYEVRDNYREFIFYLRKGVRWSDGHRYTANDILYWWKREETDTAVLAQPSLWMRFRGKPGRVEKIDDYTVRFRFEEPYALFLEQMAYEGRVVANSPAHYLSQYHPVIGDPRLIEEKMKALKLPSRESLYLELKEWDNPEHPRLWPWIYRTKKENPPHTVVRNPYFFAVDPEGNQLPYVDRLLYIRKSSDMIRVAAAAGELTTDALHVRFEDYTLLMSQREANGYEVYHLSYGGGSEVILVPNLNRRIDPEVPATRFKHELLNRKEFRQALSLAINRKGIIDVEFGGVTEPAQAAPPPDSPFYEASLYRAFTEYDPEKANRLLDQIGLTRRDGEGYRTFPDGSRMQFMVSFMPIGGGGADLVQAVVEDWAEVGVRAVAREQSIRLYTTRQVARMQDFGVWGTASQFMPLMRPWMYVPTSSVSYYALDYAAWYMRGGLFGDPQASIPGAREPPLGHPLRRALELYDRATATPDEAEQVAIFREVLKIAAENVWTISISSPAPRLAVVKNGFRNVPKRMIYSWILQSPGNAGNETFYFEKPDDSPGAIAQTTREIAKTPTVESEPNLLDHEERSFLKSGAALGKMIRTMILSIIVLLVLFTGIRHPYIGRRLLIMIPTLFIISVIAFVIIQLPPGDYLTYQIAMLEASGEIADLQRIEEMREMFRLNESMVERYLHWLGIFWFATFDERDMGLLQGYMGRSMETFGPVNELIGDRVLLTFLISLGSILFTWAIALPVGIYSAVRQYSIGDYAATFLGFLGMSIPNFLFALILMYLSAHYFGINVTGLFSPEYSAQPEWTWGKAANLLERIWVPVLVIGTAGTASMIRVMRGNLLDELKKPYVTTAVAKGVRPFKLLVKYPVRLALNPFVSGIGGLFPHLVSGGAIVAMILSLPTVGPLMLEGMLSEDMYLAGSMLMVLSMLGVLGVLVSDLLLMWIDPRIRMEGGLR